MRHTLVAAVAGAGLALAGCGGDATSSTQTPATGATGQAAPDDALRTGAGDDVAATADAAPTTGAQGDDVDVAAADEPVEDEVEGGEDGQAAADVAAAFLVAMVHADPEACDHLLSFTDLERPMTAVASDHEMCTELLPEVLRAETEAQGIDEPTLAQLEGLVINGADVDGDTAVVDADNYPPDLASSMGDAAITLKRVDDGWYVDLDNSFVVPTAP